MRLSIPDHLVSEFKILEHEGYLITQRRPGTKRSIKFNDMNRSLVMDIKLPGMAWVRINTDQIVRSSRLRLRLKLKFIHSPQYNYCPGEGNSARQRRIQCLHRYFVKNC